MVGYIFLYLTPEVFQMLDAIARSKIGYSILVLPFEKIGGFASVDVLRVIKLANKICLPIFYNGPRPEMDYSGVPLEMVYEFLVWHEIAHVVLGAVGIEFTGWWWEMDSWIRRLFVAEMERRADKYAWEMLFPNIPMPVRKDKLVHLEMLRVLFPNFPLPERKDPGINLEILNEFADKHKDFFWVREKSFSLPMSA